MRAIRCLWALPPLAALWMTYRYAVFVPTEHYFDYLPLSEDILRQGYPSFASLLTNVNEHPVLSFNLLFSAVGMAYHGFLLPGALSMALYTYASHVCAALSVLCIALIARRTHAGIKVWQRDLLILAALVIVFSPVQWIVWIQPYIGFTMTTTLAIAVIALLYCRGESWWAFGCACAFALFASFGVAAGLAIWPAALPVLCARERRWSRAARWMLGIWLALAFAVFCMFLSRSTFVTSTPVDIHTWYRLPAFVLILTGSSLSQHVRIAEMAGLLPPLLMIFVLVRLRGLSRLSSPWIGIGLFALGAATLVALGRYEFGKDYALRARYVPFTCVAWIASLYLMALLNRRAAVLVCSVALVMLAQIVAWPRAIAIGEQWRAELTEAKTCMSNYAAASDACLSRLYFQDRIPLLRERLRTMERLGLL